MRRAVAATSGAWCTNAHKGTTRFGQKTQWSRLQQAWTSTPEPYSGWESVPRPAVVRPPVEADALLAFTLFEAYQASRWALALPSYACRLAAPTALRRERPETTTWPRSRVSIRPTLEGSPKRPLSLPEVFHLIQSPPDLPPTTTSKPAAVVSNNSRKQEPSSGFGCHKQW